MHYQKSKILIVAFVWTLALAGTITIAWFINRPKITTLVHVKEPNKPVLHVGQDRVDSRLDMQAMLLTGRIPSNGLPQNMNKEDWDSFSTLAKSSWQRYEGQIGKPMQVWASKEISSTSPSVFYPFSGPDFTTLYQLFPQKSHYVMVAQQRGEKLVDLSSLRPSSAGQTLEVLGSAWKSYGVDGFFVTEYLYKYLSTNKVKIGATTLIASFLSLHDFSILKIVPIHVTPQGQVEELAQDDSWNSVRFYLAKDGRNVQLDYLSLDLSDGGLKARPENYEFIKLMSVNPTLLKAASHLPQHPGFTMIKEAMLENAPYIVQDETGLNYKPLSAKFETKLYGAFVKSYKVFQTYNKELAQAYLERDDESPLPFRVGYYKDGAYAVIVAKRKQP
ncbi:MAG: hypothetical protein WCK52_04265 [Betaproteobacteria bacterium]|jgi:hypothetical protein